MSQSIDSKLETLLEKPGVANNLQILVLVLQKGPIDRKTLIQLSGLPPQTVHDTLNRLLCDDLVKKSCQRPNGVPGRPREVFEAIPRKKKEDQAGLDVQLKALESRAAYRRPNRAPIPPRTQIVPIQNEELYQFICRRCFRTYVSEEYQESRQRVCLVCAPI